MGKILQSSNKNILQHRHGAPKLCHPGAKVGAQAQRSMADFRKSVLNQVPAQIQRTPYERMVEIRQEVVQRNHEFAQPVCDQFDAARRKEAVNKASFASMCGISDTEYYDVGIPSVFLLKQDEQIRLTGDGKWECLEHKMIFKTKSERFRHWRLVHKRASNVIKKNGQFKKPFNNKHLRAIQNRAREVFSDGEYEKLQQDKPTYAGDLPLIDRNGYPDHITLRHFDIIQADKITAQINNLMNQSGSKMHDREHDDDDQTSEYQILAAKFTMALDLNKDINEYVSSNDSALAAFVYSSEEESFRNVLLDGKHQITPVSGVQFYLTNGGEVFDNNRSADWQPDSVSEINLPKGQVDSVSHLELGSAYYADISDKRVSSNQSMLD